MPVINLSPPFSRSDPISFTSQILLPEDAEFVSVECFQIGSKKTIHKNVHFVVQRKESVLKRIALASPKPSTTASSPEESPKRPLSVLMIGIDSISRLNLLRAMPHTAQHLYDNGWFEMKGYNKMGDNTYPNLMAIVTGYNETWAYEKCQPHLEKRLDTCPFIWKDYAASGYVTGYAEDEPEIGTVS